MDRVELAQRAIGRIRIVEKLRAQLFQIEASSEHAQSMLAADIRSFSRQPQGRC
jgi:hypothetical protein